MEKRIQAHIFGGTFIIFIAAGSKHGMLVFMLGGTKSLSRALLVRCLGIPQFVRGLFGKKAKVI